MMDTSPRALPAVRDFLVAHFGGEIADLAPIGHGEWSRAYAFRHGGTAYVVRFSPLAEDFAKDRLAAAFASPPLPIPPIRAIGRAFDGFYTIAERVPGGYLDELDEAGMRRTLPALFAALDAARRVDLSTTTGYGGWGADGNAPHRSWRAALLDIASDRPTGRLHGWRERLGASSVGLGPFTQAYRQLQALVDACPKERHLIHSDLLHYNVLVEGDRLTAVLDWGCSLYGDFLYDIAWFTFWAPWFPAWAAIDFRAEARRRYAAIGLEVPQFEERLRCYELHIGLGSLVYSAYKARWDFLETVARHTLARA